MSAYSRRSVTWRYLPRRTVKHALLVDSGISGHRSTALCGISPSWFAPDTEQWWGTGTQDEYEQAERLPECRRCARLLAPAAETSNPTPTKEKAAA